MNYRPGCLWLLLTLLATGGNPSATAAPFDFCGFQSAAAPAKLEAPVFKTPKAAAAPTRYLVRLKTASQFAKAAAASIVRPNIPADARIETLQNDLISVEFNDPGEAQNSAAELKNNEAVSYVEPDYAIHADFTPNDPQINRQWAHVAVQSFAAWDISQGSPNVIVAVLDTGIDLTHPDLQGNIYRNPAEIPNNGIDDDGNGFIDDVNGWNFVAGTNDSQDDNMHGSHVSGILGALTDNGYGMAGESPKVRLLPLKVLDSSGNGTTTDAIKAITYAIAAKARIINASWGDSGFSQALKDTIESAHQAGILFITAAGNDAVNADTTPHYPANDGNANIISVASSNCSDEISSFSNWGAKSIDLAAPGETIFSTLNGGEFGYLSGTSMATPMVSGVAALIAALRPDLTPEQIKSVIVGNVDQTSEFIGKLSSNGRLNAVKALQALKAVPHAGALLNPFRPR